MGTANQPSGWSTGLAKRQVACYNLPLDKWGGEMIAFSPTFIMTPGGGEGGSWKSCVHS